MNTNQLKRFAQEARIKLLKQVEAKLAFVLTSDSPELREKANEVKQLNDELSKTTKAQLIEKVAYTWFNRLMALRFMDANDYQPLGIRIITPKDGYTLPELLDATKQGNIPEELTVKTQHIYDLLDGKVKSSNPQNEAYKELLIGACNHLNKVFPFLFERINDYTELLMPDDLISEFSIIQDVREGMSTEDCQEVEIIGWLYQFYISEKKDEVFASKSKVKKEDIPAATQLFTPRWIVEYMVQNTVGKLWLQNRPNSKLREHMPYFIESPSVAPSQEKSEGQNGEDYLKVNSVEEITLLDQACGSGHILVYGFELFTKIYEEEGYNPTEIPQLIVEKNLFGFEIDERAAQLAGLALMMKARSYQRRVFRKELKPNILCYQDLHLTTDEIKETFTKVGVDLSDNLLYDLINIQQATNLGSLIIPDSELDILRKTLAEINRKNNPDVFLTPKLKSLKEAISQLILLSKKHHCVVDNPPYMGGGAMNKELADFVKTNYPDSKADLMACFMEAGLKILKPKGFLGMINQQSWMFLSSYEKLRESLIKKTFFDTLLHLGPRTFPEIGGEVVQNASFTFWNTQKDEKGSYIRLVDDGSSELKRTKTLEAIQSPNCGWFYTANQKDFEKIPGGPIAYWLSNIAISSFKKPLSNEILIARHGLLTGNDSHYLKYWFEPMSNKIGFFCKEYDDIDLEETPFYPMNKGGAKRKWYGNMDYVVYLKDFKSTFNNNKTNESNLFFKEGITWSEINTGGIATRYTKQGILFGHKGPTAFLKEKEKLTYFLGFSNTKPFNLLKAVINSTLSFTSGNMEIIPTIIDKKKLIGINKTVLNCINISEFDWDTREGSWNFLQNELTRITGKDIEKSYNLYQQYWKNKFFQLHKNEEELNQQFIEIYGLQEELTPDVPLEDITILKEETRIENGELVFNTKEIFAQFMSYAVGCMFGRYSLDKEGLILANQGETLEDYLQIIGAEKSLSGDFGVSFLPDDDNIIPILDEEWFEDDIVGRFNEFLKVTFGEENFSKNLAFVEEQLGKDIRRYFMRDFYADHIKRYKRRPIYWLFSSPKGAFNVLIYMHRYTQDTVSNILNKYLREFSGKLKTRKETLQHIIVHGAASDKTKAIKENDSIDKMLLDLHEYERDILYPIATERISIDLDDGVLVNFNKFGNALKAVPGLNDKKTKDKVRKFDWIDITQIR